MPTKSVIHESVLGVLSQLKIKPKASGITAANHRGLLRETDEHAVMAEPCLRHQRVGGTEVPGGGHVGGQPWLLAWTTGHHHVSPRPSGRRHRRAASCCPKSRFTSSRDWPAACSRAAHAVASSGAVSAVTPT